MQYDTSALADGSHPEKSARLSEISISIGVSRRGRSSRRSMLQNDLGFKPAGMSMRAGGTLLVVAAEDG